MMRYRRRESLSVVTWWSDVRPRLLFVFLIVLSTATNSVSSSDDDVNLDYSDDVRDDVNGRLPTFERFPAATLDDELDQLPGE